MYEGTRVALKQIFQVIDDLWLPMFQGQPNAMTGVCDEDVMVINNGRTSFELCGWNSGQHGEND